MTAKRANVHGDRDTDRGPALQDSQRGSAQPDHAVVPREPIHRYLGNRYMQRLAIAARAAHGESELPPIVREVVRGPGQPLDPATRTFMESRFAADFGHVRVHTDQRAAESADAVDARAYTLGSHVVFGPGTYAPSGRSGRELLAHELAHTVQQRCPNEAPPSGDPGGVHEATAVAAARAVAGGQMVSQELPSSGVGLSRAPAPRARSSPRLDPRMRTWRRYGAEEGRRDAARLRKKGQLSSEDRQAINAKLSFFEGKAYENYVREITPALSQYAGADSGAKAKPSASSPGQQPSPETTAPDPRREHTIRYFAKMSDARFQRYYVLVLQDILAGDTRWDLDTLEEITHQRFPNAEWHENARQEFLANRQAQQLELERQAILSQSPDYWKNQMGALAEQTQKWPAAAQQIAKDLLWKWFELRRKTGTDAGIEQAIRDDLVSQFEQVLRAAEKQVQAECSTNRPDWKMRIHGDPCAPWFGGVLSKGYTAVREFERTLANLRDRGGVPYRTVVFWVEAYVKQPVPTSVQGRYLDLLRMRSQLGVALNLAVRPMARLPVPPAAPPPVHAPKPVTAGVVPAEPFPRVDVTQGRAFGAGLPARPAATVPPRAAPPSPGSSASPRRRLSLKQRLLRDRVVANVIRGAEASEVYRNVGAGRAPAAITAKAPPPQPAPTPTPIGRVTMAPRPAPAGGRVSTQPVSRPTLTRAPVGSPRGVTAPSRPSPGPTPGAPVPTTPGVGATRSAVNLVTQGTGFDHGQILDLFVRHFQRPGPPQGTIFVHPTEASFEAAVQAAGLPPGTFGFFAHPQEAFAPDAPGGMGLIHLPPSVSTLVAMHESLHMIALQSGVIQMLGQYVEEGLTEWLARSLGPQTIRGLYDANVAFVRLLAGVVGEDTLRAAYLHRRWAPLRSALRARLGGDAAVNHFYGLLRQVGPHGQRGGVLQEAIDMLWPGSAERAARATARPAAGNPAAARPRGSRRGGGPASAAATPKQPDTSSTDDRQVIEEGIAKATASFLRPGSKPLNPKTLRPSGEQVLTAQSQERARAQWEEALLPVAQEPTGGRIGSITIEGVYFSGIQVTRRGTELLVGYFGVERRSAPSGAAPEVHEALEKAAFQVARQVRARSVRVYARKVVNDHWRRMMLARGYTAFKFDEMVLAKRFPVPQDLLSIGEDRLKQSLPPVPAQWPDRQTFGVSGIKWRTGPDGARIRLQELKKMSPRQAIRELREAGVTLAIAEKWRFHYYFEYYVAGVPNPTTKAREELMTFVVELMSGQHAGR